MSVAIELTAHAEVRQPDIIEGMKLPITAPLRFSMASGSLVAEAITHLWTGACGTVDASGVKQSILQILELEGNGKETTGLPAGRRGSGIPLKVIQEGEKFTLPGDIEFEGGEHLRWDLEPKDGQLSELVWAEHVAPKKWGFDWSGPVEFTRSTQR